MAPGFPLQKERLNQSGQMPDCPVQMEGVDVGTVSLLLSIDTFTECLLSAGLWERPLQGWHSGWERWTLHKDV